MGEGVDELRDGLPLPLGFWSSHEIYVICPSHFIQTLSTIHLFYWQRIDSQPKTLPFPSLLLDAFSP